MPRVEIAVQHSVGLHARPASLFVKSAARFPCGVSVRNVTAQGKAVNAKSILSVLTLGVQKGHTIEIVADGPQAEDALTCLQELVSSNFGEG